MYSIQDGTSRKTGLKTTDIRTEINDIIDSAKDTLIICGYSFTSPKHIDSVLRRVIDSKVKHKRCIMPLYLSWKSNANRMMIIELIKNGVSVSIEQMNHSKWMMSESKMYYGSANFSRSSLRDKIEVITFRDFLPGDKLKSQFSRFVYRSMKDMRYRAKHQFLQGINSKNKKLISQTQTLVKRFNPSINKVVRTINSIEIVKAKIEQVAGNCFWLLDDAKFKSLFNATQYNLKNLKFVNDSAINLLIENDKSNLNSESFETKRKIYNEYCDNFFNTTNSYQTLAEDYIITSKEYPIPQFTKLNLDLVEKAIPHFNKYQ